VLDAQDGAGHVAEDAAVDALPAPAKPPTTPVAEVMIPAPRTIRPEVRVDDAVVQLRKDGLDQVFITAVNGVLVGLVITDQLPDS
jgi:CBS domain-containing protein